MGKATAGRALVLGMAMLAAGLPLTGEAAPEGPCAPFVPRPGLGLSCEVPGGFWLRLADGSAMFTHGPDFVPPDAAWVAPATLPSAPLCVEDPLQYAIQVVYARPADKPDRYAAVAPGLRVAIAEANSLVHASGDLVGVAMNYRVRCTAGVVDVGNAVLATPSGSDSLSTVPFDLRAAGFNNGRTKYWSFYDDCIAPYGCGFGFAGFSGDDRLALNNSSNNGNSHAVSVGTDFRPNIVHELGHSMGAVQDSTPHSSGAAHCNDGQDIMCYADGGPTSNYTASICSGWWWDCNLDDYCNPRPEPGSYLVNHWNLCWRLNRFVEIEGNAPPIVNPFACIPASVSVGSPIACSVVAGDDGDAVHYDVAWGDGATERVPASGTVATHVPQALTHAYAAPGSYVVSVTATDTGAPPATSPARTFAMLVDPNDPPVLDPLACEGAVSEFGQEVACTLRAADDSSGVAYDIAWGDGATERFPAQGLLPPGQARTVRHAWTSGGPTSMTVTATDNGLPVLTSAPAALAHDVWCGAAARAEPVFLASTSLANPEAWLRSAAWDSRGRLGQASGSEAVQFGRVDLPGPYPGFVLAPWGLVHGQRATGSGSADAEMVLEEATLLGGMVYVRGLRTVATASVAGVAQGQGTAAGSGFTSVGLLRVNGAEVPVEGAHQVVPLPGLGYLVLNETLAPPAPGGAASQRTVNGLRLVLEHPTLRGELVLGRASVRASCLDGFGTPDRVLDNDAASGGDAGDGPAQAVELQAPAVVQGRVLGADALDHYAVRAGPGMKVQAELLSTAGASLGVNPPGQVPAVGTTLPALRLALLEPGTFVERDASDLPGLAERVELNVDVDGLWVLSVAQDSLPGGNYTLAVTVTPILLAEQDDGGSGGDAPDACGGPLPLVEGTFSGVLRDADHRDFLGVEVPIGESLAVALKPTEDLDGADFDLFLYDEACTLLASSQLGKDPAGPGTGVKGVPEAVTLAPAQHSATYVLEVRRVNGIGNYHAHAQVLDPMPSAAPLDAEMGDAGATPGAARPAPLLGQGAFPDGDAEDWYAIPVQLGQRVAGYAVPSALSTLSLQLLRPDGSVASASDLPSSAPEAVQAFANQAGTWHLRVVRTGGGGDYLVGGLAQDLVVV